MYPFDLRKTEEKQYTAMPGPVADRIRPWLERNNLEYEILSEEEIPDDIPRGCIFFGGQKVMFGCAYVHTNLNSEELTKAAEEMMRLPRSEI